MDNWDKCQKAKTDQPFWLWKTMLKRGEISTRFPQNWGKLSWLFLPDAKLRKKANSFIFSIRFFPVNSFKYKLEEREKLSACARKKEGQKER